MIKAIFFDLYNTLITYSPSREETHINLLKKHNISITKKAISSAIKAGDAFFYRENSRSLVKSRTSEEQEIFWRNYEKTVLKQADIEPAPELIDDMLKEIDKIQYTMVPFDDVLPALEDLKKQGYKLGIISNIDRDISPMCKEMGFSPFLEIIFTSHQTGLYKPSPEIFHLACKKTGVLPKQAIYVGDQYQIDVVGASKAGLTGVLVDRDEMNDEQPVGYRVNSLMDVSRLAAEIVSS